MCEYDCVCQFISFKLANYVTNIGRGWNITECLTSPFIIYSFLPFKAGEYFHSLCCCGSEYTAWMPTPPKRPDVPLQRKEHSSSATKTFITPDAPLPPLLPTRFESDALSLFRFSRLLHLAVTETRRRRVWNVGEKGIRVRRAIHRYTHKLQAPDCFSHVGSPFLHGTNYFVTVGPIEWRLIPMLNSSSRAEFHNDNTSINIKWMNLDNVLLDTLLTRQMKCVMKCLACNLLLFSLQLRTYFATNLSSNVCVFWAKLILFLCAFYAV